MIAQPTALVANPQDMYPKMDYMRWDIINALIKKHGYKSYLEIGVFNPELNFNKIQCIQKIGVDPDPNSKATIHLTSDEFFINHVVGNKLLPDGKKGMFFKKYDIIFIDGLHEAEQVYRDIINALACLIEGGTIVCHDMNPTSELMASPIRKTRLWCGNCWQAWVKLRQQRSDLNMFVIDTDFGVGIIQLGKQKKIKSDAIISWNDFQKNKQAWLNLISVEQFKESLI